MTRHGWLAVTVIMTVVLALTLRFRRSDFALYRSFGMTRLRLCAMVWTETAILVGLGALVAAPSVSGGLLIASADAAVAAHSISQAARAIVALTVVGAALGMVGLWAPLAAQIKE